jgi:hypothetical protein
VFVEPRSRAIVNSTRVLTLSQQMPIDLPHAL